LSDRSRRPVRYAHQLPGQIESLIVSLKREKPHWGARKIRELLVRRLDGDIRVPAKSTIHAVLHRHGLVKLPGRPRHRASGTPLSAPAYPMHDREVLVTACGRICMHRKRVNISTALAGQRLGLKEIDDGIWIVSFMRYDLGFIDLAQKTLQPIDNPFGPGVSPMS
jgi:hypothetical protein